METKPLSVVMLAAEKDGENVVLRFAASNGHSYSLILSPASATRSAKAVLDFNGLQKTDEILTLTPTRAWTPVRPDNRQGLAVHTREGETISIELPEGTIPALEACLEALLSTPRPTPKRQRTRV